MRPGTLGRDSRSSNSGSANHRADSLAAAASVEATAPPIGLMPEPTGDEFHQDPRELGPPPTYEEATAINSRNDGPNRTIDTSTHDSSIRSRAPSRPTSRNEADPIREPKKKASKFKKGLENLAFFFIDLID